MAKNQSSRTIKARSAKSRRFTLGRSAFSKVSPVEGVVVSRGLKADLHRLSNVSPEKRRAALAQKYWKK
jgi:hypothetical protein